MLSGLELNIVRLDFDTLVIFVVFLNKVDEGLPIMLLDQSLTQTRDHIEAGVDTHDGKCFGLKDLRQQKAVLITW